MWEELKPTPGCEPVALISAPWFLGAWERPVIWSLLLNTLNMIYSSTFLGIMEPQQPTQK